ncbi:OpgC domain-containing protein [Devosia sp. ZB163]|uniref:OpgC family protein n=1 Tax=Devosia sp. ZB163 TaxID=3025938 RepID=UPI00235DF575|nr:OpgC domain-containing protein [Devosia sp. ZB163]MDC9823373.1 OpgC domain-containing protein [Devosia sp. ZB163]
MPDSQPALLRAPLGERLKGWLAIPMGTDTTAPLKGRDARLDMFRGLALLMIFINHVPGTFYETLTSRNFGFSDAAEAFVFMSGLAAGLAYSGKLATGPLWPAIAKVWARARHLYFVHLSITMMALAVFAAAALWFGLYELLGKNNLAPLFATPLEAMIGLPLMTHQLGYLNILPLYITLLLATPAIILAGLRWPVRTLIGSIALWVIAGQFRLNLPNFPTPGGWFFNPLSWQILFVIGLLSGMAMKQGKRFVPRSPWLFGAAAAFLLLVLVWVKVPPVGDAGRQVLGFLSKLGLPFYVTWFDKTFLALPRLLHALALFYVVASLGVMRQVSESKWTAPLRLMGRQGLAVFATGTVISLFLQAVKAGISSNIWIDTLLLGAGVAVLVLLAHVLTRTQQMTRAAAAVSA